MYQEDFGEEETLKVATKIVNAMDEEIVSSEGGLRPSENVPYMNTNAKAEFIAYSCEDVPKLLNEIERLNRIIYEKMEGVENA